MRTFWGPEYLHSTARTLTQKQFEEGLLRPTANLRISDLVVHPANGDGFVWVTGTFTDRKSLATEKGDNGPRVMYLASGRFKYRAADVFGAPIGAINLIDAQHRLRIVAVCGLSDEDARAAAVLSLALPDDQEVPELIHGRLRWICFFGLSLDECLWNQGKLRGQKKGCKLSTTCPDLSIAVRPLDPQFLLNSKGMIYMNK